MSADRKPIQPSEIRAGDTIEMESEGWSTRCVVGKVTDTRIYNEEQSSTWLPHHGGTFYLLDRPTPPVELPRGSHFGTLTWVDADGNSGGTLAAEWLIDANYAEALNFGRIDLARVRSFDRMTAVPTEALDLLRLYVTGLDDLPILRAAERATAEFLAAVDEANGVPS